MSGRPAVFLDRDGVLNELVAGHPCGMRESPLEPSEVQLIAGAAGAALRLGLAGYILVCVTNQPAAAKGEVTLAQLLAVHRRVLELLCAQDVCLRASRLCVHHPAGVVDRLTTRCDCRKPSPGMLLEAADTFGIDLERSWMVGDTDADVLAGKAAGCRTLLVGNPGSAHKRFGEVEADLEAATLAAGVERLLAHKSETFD